MGLSKQFQAIQDADDELRAALEFIAANPRAAEHIRKAREHLREAPKELGWSVDREVASGSDPTPEQRLALLQARARRRAATSLRYPDPADEADELHATVLGALPAQLRAVANIDESN